MGVRYAGRLATQIIMGPDPRIAAASSARPVSPVMGQVGAPGSQTVGRTGRAVTRGVGGFLAPFRRVGGILWLEVTGVFFLLPVVVFAPVLWKEGVAYPHSNNHRTFWVTAGIVVVFLYLGASSFWRARKR